MGLNLNKNFSPFILILIILSITSITWLVVNNVSSGQIFFTITILFILSMLLLWIFFKEQRLILKEPIQQKFSASSMAFILLASIPILLFLLPTLFGYNSVITAKTFVPLSASKIVSETTSQSFATVNAEVNPTYRLLTITQYAPIIEELFFGFGLLFLLFALFTRVFKEKKILPAVAAIPISALMFSLMHQLNGDYLANPIAFVGAFIFRCILNALILYNPGIGLAGTIGFHFGNNFIWFVSSQGWNETLIGMTSGYGLLYFGFLILCGIYVIIQLLRKKLFIGDLLVFKTPG